jgi:hypothetical protein
MDFRGVVCEEGNLAGVDSIEQFYYHCEGVDFLIPFVVYIFIYKKIVTENYLLM